jgi:Family with sequence similarity 184, A and B
MAAVANPAPPGAGVSSTPIPPDVHFKMCKKIALLTKVVYHLNIKNEDSEASVNALRKRHEEELRRVTEDAVEKINRLADAVANNQEVKVLEAALAELTDRYNREKELAQVAIADRQREFA